MFCISIFFLFFFFQILEWEAFQVFCPLLNFQTLEMFPVFLAFPVFLGKKKRGKFWGKSCSIRTALRAKNTIPGIYREMRVGDSNNDTVVANCHAHIDW